jgi:replicative DNA helicase
MLETTRLDLERLVLASLICREGQGIDETMLMPDDFSVRQNRNIFEAIGKLHTQGTNADAPTIMVALGNPKDGTAALLADLNRAVFSGSNLFYYADQLKDSVFQEKTNSLHKSVGNRINNGEDSISILNDITEKFDALRNRYKSTGPKAKLAEACLSILKAIESRTPTPGIIKTGISAVDDMCGGLIPGEYVVLAARPSCGKTTLALNIAHNLARNNIKTCFVSLEMKAPSLAAKMLAMISGRNTKMVLRNPAEIDYEASEDMINCSDELFATSEKIDVHDETGPDVGPIHKAIRESVKAGAKLLVLDYLQLMNCPGENRNQQVSAISRWFKNTVSALNIPGIALCQLSRDSEREKRPPRMSDLRDSGSIEQDADIVWFLHRDKENQDSPIVKLIQAKGRTTGIGFRELHFRRDSQTFHDVERRT